MKTLEIISMISSILVMLLLGFLVIFVLTQEKPKEVQTSYEYKIISPDDLSLEKELDKSGADGWQVVFARRATSGSGYYSTAAYEMILMRKK